MELQVAKQNEPQITLIKNMICRDASDNELALFVAQCKRTGLDPLSKQIYAIRVQGRLVIMASIDGLRLIAERTGKYAGQIGPQWCGEDGVWKDVWLSSNPPAAAKVGIVRSDFKEVVWGVATYRSYVKQTPIWKSMPDIMLSKCAEALALRKAFPNDISGLYEREEIDIESASATEQAQFRPQLPSPQPEKQDILESTVQEEKLPKSLRGKAITWLALATDPNITFFSEKLQRNLSGRQLLHIWEGGKDRELAVIAETVLSATKKDKVCETEKT